MRIERRFWGRLARVRLGLLLVATSCAFHTQGVVRRGGGGTQLEMADGRRVRLVLMDAATPLAELDAYQVEVWGQRLGRSVRVGDWRVGDGLHGMPTWVGPVEIMGVQVGVQDRNTGAFYWLDEHAARTLEKHAGRIVLLEGYIDGPHRLKVLHYQILSKERGSGGAGPAEEG